METLTLYGRQLHLRQLRDNTRAVVASWPDLATELLDYMDPGVSSAEKRGYVLAAIWVLARFYAATEPNLSQSDPSQ